MYTQEQINAMSVDQMKAALLQPVQTVQQAQPTQVQQADVSTQQAAQQSTPSVDDFKAIVRAEISAALDAEQAPAISFTEAFLEKHHVSPAVASGIAVGAIGGIVEIIKALLPILFK